MVALFRSAANFTRLSMLGLTVINPILGILSTGRAPSPRGIGVGFLVAASLHVAMYVLNDVVDTEIDRTEPRRVRSPLVNGSISRRSALAVAGTSIVASFAFDRVLPDNYGPRQLALLGAFVALTIYDLFGKRCVFPPLTDFTQGAGCGLLVVYGALANGEPTVLTWTAAGFIVVYFAMINGLHGSLRDLPNDSQHGVRSTAIFLGARATGDSLYVPLRLRLYGLGLQGCLAALGVIALLQAHKESGGWTVLWVGTTVISLSVALLFRAYRQTDTPVRLRLAGAAHLVVSILPIVIAAVAGRGVVMELLVPALGVGPLFANAWYRGAFAWLVAGKAPPLEPGVRTRGLLR